MTDIYSRDKRSQIMARVRASGTRPELVVRQVAHRLGYRFRLHRKDLPGRPDLVFPRHRKVVLVHGCFWHGHENCRKARRPGSNAAFWDAKLARNIERDRQTLTALTCSGWRVLTVWECETRRPEQLAERLRGFLSSANPKESQ